MKKSYSALAAVAAFVLTAFCGCGDDDGPVDPVGELRPEHVVCSSNVSFSERWVQPGDIISADIELSVNTPGDAYASGLRVNVDGKDVGVYSFPLSEPLRYEASSFMHGVHNMKFYFTVKRGRQEIEVTPIRDFNFVVFDSKPSYSAVATVDVAVSAKSTNDETFERNFTLNTDSKGRVHFTRGDFTWYPAQGTAHQLDVEMTVTPQVTVNPDGLQYKVRNILWNMPDSVVADKTVKLKWSNPVTIEDFNGLNASFVVYVTGRHENLTLSDSTAYTFPVTLENDKVEL